jgi:hypothetical protein
MVGKRRRNGLALVLPGVILVNVFGVVPAREQTIKLISVQEALIDNGGYIGEIERILREPKIILQKVANDPAKEGDIGPGADRCINVSQCRGAGEGWIDVNYGRALLLRLEHEAEGDRMVLRHVRAHHHHAIGISQVPLR